jgi:hypothetical protein
VPGGRTSRKPAGAKHGGALLRRAAAAGVGVALVLGAGSALGDGGGVDGGDQTSQLVLTRRLAGGPERLDTAMGAAVDAHGNVYVVDDGASRVYRISPCGQISLLAGTGTEGRTGDGGPATMAALSEPLSVSTDGQGNVYIDDQSGMQLRRVAPDGTISTVASYDWDGVKHLAAPPGPANDVRLHEVLSPVADDAGNVYFIDAETIDRITPDGWLSVYAGGGGSTADGVPATQARIDDAFQLAWKHGHLYVLEHAGMVADQGLVDVRDIAPDGTVRTIIGVRGASDWRPPTDGAPASAAFPGESGTSSIAADGAGDVYISASPQGVWKEQGGVLRRITATTLQLLPLYRTARPYRGGPARRAPVANVTGATTDAQDNLYLTGTRFTGDGDAAMFKVWKPQPGPPPTFSAHVALARRPPPHVRFTVSASCHDPCFFSAAGSVALAGARWPLAATRTGMAAGACPATLSLGFARPADESRFRSTLAKRGGPATATLSVTAQDPAGQRRTRRVTIAVR